MGEEVVQLGRSELTRSMTWASVLSEEPSIDSALDEAVAGVDQQMANESPDLILFFMSPGHSSRYDEIPARLAASEPGALLIGCSAGGVVGAGREVERSPALSLTAASLPDVRLQPFHLDLDRIEHLARDPESWYELVGFGGDTAAQFLLFPDPFTCDASALIESLDAAFPKATVVGGLASGASGPGENALCLGSAIHSSGVVGVAMRGPIAMDTIVAQGCRPIGAPLFVTKAVGNRILELDGRRPTEVMTELFAELSDSDRELFRRSLFLGVVMREGLQEYLQGDFLIRNLLGIDSETGVLAIGESLRAGQVVQFHLRDAETSSAELEALLLRYRRESNGPRPRGALLFSCMGRGEGLYGEPDHDSRMLRENLGVEPIGGFFCNGEIGPVHGRTFLHGYTSSVALFHPKGS